MPSLHALGEFRTSFQNLGNEIKTLKDLKLPIDDFPLPDHESVALEAPEEESSSDFSSEAEDSDITSSPEPDDTETYNEPPEADSDSSETDFFGNLGDLLGGMSDETIPDSFGDDNLLSDDDESAPEYEVPGQDAGASDDELLNIGDNDEFDPGDLGLDILDPPGSDPDGDEASLGGLPDFMAGTETDAVAETGDEAQGDSDAFDFGDLGLDDLTGFSEPSDTSESPDLSEPSDPSDSSDFSDLPGFSDSSDPSESMDLSDPSDFSDLPDFSDSSDLSESMDLSDPSDFPEPSDPSDLSDFSDLPDFGADESPDIPGGESFETPGEDLSFGDLPDFMEETATDAGAETGDEAPGGSDAFDFGDMGLDDLPDFSEPSAVSEPSDLPESPDFSDSMDLSDPSDFSDSMDFDAGGSPDFSGEDGFELAGEDDSLDFTEETDEKGKTDFDDATIDFGEEPSDYGAEAFLEEITGDSFDSFSPDTNLGAGFDIGGGDDFGGLDEFSIPGLDAAFDEFSPATPKAGGKTSSRVEEVEEITLSSEELEQFLNTLSSYPLNLRIACQELIVEQAVAPDQMSKLVKLLVTGTGAKEAAALAGKILDRSIPVPKGYEKLTGEALEEEQSSFAYIFVHNFLPVFRLFMMISLVLLSVGYLSYRYIYRPNRAERIYRLGIERIAAGEYRRASERFWEAFHIYAKKSWFYTYARAFRDARQFTLAEEKYQELLHYTAARNRHNIPEKAAVLEYAHMMTYYIGDFETADRLIRRNILDFRWDDAEALLALGDNSMAWSEHEPERLEDARAAYALLIERYGRSDLLLERMLRYFIRMDDLQQVLALQSYFMASPRRVISAASLVEMGGYFLDKRFEEVRGVPNQFLDHIGGIREILLRAIHQDPWLPESYYHLARYYNYFGNLYDEMLTLRTAVHVFEQSNEGSPRHIKYHINALRRYAEILSSRREFFPAEENLVKAASLYQNALSRRLLTRSPEFGKIYANLGDLEFFVKDGNMQRALDYYRLAEQHGWAPPEIQYRMGVAHYQLRQWGPALDRFTAVHREITPNRRILYALGNASYMRGNYFAAQGYYDRLLELLSDDRSRLPPIMATDDENQLDLAERLMVAQNNLGVTLEVLTERTGDNAHRSRALGLFTDSERAWDVLTRNPATMIRMRPSPDITAPGVNPAFLNVQNSLRPVPGFEAHFFLRIDRDILEPSPWEALALPGHRLSEGIHTGR